MLRNGVRGVRDGIHVSVVSHAQSELVWALLQDLAAHCTASVAAVTLTVNRPETLGFDPQLLPFPLHLIANPAPRGFSANHNAAFRRGLRDYPCRYFCVINPDIRLAANPFDELVSDLAGDSGVGVVAPLVRSPQGEVEDSARHLPTPLSIVGKALGRGRGPDYAAGALPMTVDWVAGMMMLMRMELFQRVGGFDERHFLYYEDVSLCCRLRLMGYRAMLDPRVSVTHDARRASHRDLRHFRWHLASMARFFASPLFLRCWRRMRASHDV